MSRTKRLHKGADEAGPRACDYYATPAWVTAALMPVLDELSIRTYIDPCAGDGAILRVIRDHVSKREVPTTVRGYEIRPEAVEQCRLDGLSVRQMDFLDDREWPSLVPQITLRGNICIVMNPPYGGRDNTAQRFIDTSIKRLRAFAGGPSGRECFVAALLRTMWINDGQATHRRISWLRETVGMPDVYLLPQRPSFTGRGTDATTYAWFVWTVSEQTRRTGFVEALEARP